jgi:uncharacterized membrane protein
MERGGTCRRPWRRMAQEQDGLLREALFFLALVCLFAVILLDVISIYSTHRAVKEDAKRAAEVAVAAYVQTASDAAAQQAAAAYLGSHKTQLVTFTVKRSQDATAYEVTARRKVDTLLLKYVGHLPKIGRWMDRQLHPEATAGNR